MSIAGHKPVLLRESLELLAIKPNGVYLDGTFGRGGHSRAILDSLGQDGHLFACDKDLDAITYASNNICDARFTLVHENFATMESWLRSRSITLDGILLDLGVSSPQLDTAERGFSFNQDGALDMRMNTTSGITAAEWINTVVESDLADVLWKFGEERHSRRIAKNIVQARNKQAITRTLQLAQIIADSVPGYHGFQHKATKSFQAIRIFINRELDHLQLALETLPYLLKSGGRMVVISFHSLEDRLVKTAFTALSTVEKMPKWVAITDKAEKIPAYQMIAKKVRAGLVEVTQNVRSRSAVMRCIERVHLD